MQRRALTTLATLCLSLPAWAAVPDDGFPAEPLDLDRALDDQQRTVVEDLAATLERLDQPFTIAAVIPELTAAHASFADFDGDGDLDVISGEMSHVDESLALHLQHHGRWLLRGRRNAYDGRHPILLEPLQDDGAGGSGVVVSYGWKPYLAYLPVDRHGRLGKPRALTRYLRPRLSKAAGVDNSPYSILEVRSAQADAPATVTVHFSDTDRGGVTHSEVRVIAMRMVGGRPRFKVLSTEEPEPDDDELPPPVLKAESDLELALPMDDLIFAEVAIDVDQDGIDERVGFTLDLAAHHYRKGANGWEESSVGPAPAQPDRYQFYLRQDRELIDVGALAAVRAIPIAGAPPRILLQPAHHWSFMVYTFDHETGRWQPQRLRRPYPRTDQQMGILVNNFPNDGYQVESSTGWHSFLGVTHLEYLYRREDDQYVPRAKARPGSEPMVGVVNLWHLFNNDLGAELLRLPEPVFIPDNPREGMPLNVAPALVVHPVSGERRFYPLIFIREWQLGIVLRPQPWTPPISASPMGRSAESVREFVQAMGMDLVVHERPGAVVMAPAGFDQEAMPAIDAAAARCDRLLPEAPASTENAVIGMMPGHYHQWRCVQHLIDNGPSEGLPEGLHQGSKAVAGEVGFYDLSGYDHAASRASAAYLYAATRIHRAAGGRCPDGLMLGFAALMEAHEREALPQVILDDWDSLPTIDRELRARLHETAKETGLIGILSAGRTSLTAPPEQVYLAWLAVDLLTDDAKAFSRLVSGLATGTPMPDALEAAYGQTKEALEARWIRRLGRR